MHRFLDLAGLLFTILISALIVAMTGLVRLVLGVNALVCRIVLVSLVIATPATAATVALDPVLINQLGQLAAGVILALGAVAWKWFETHNPIKNAQANELMRTAASALLDKAAEFGASQAESELKMVGTVEVGNAGIAAGANFALAHGLDMLKKLGFDGTTFEGQAAIIRMVTARMTQYAHPDDTGYIPLASFTLPASVALAGTPTPAPKGPPLPTH